MRKSAETDLATLTRPSSRTDFNIAVHLHYSTSSAAGQAPKLKPLTGVAGSMAYMAPEVLAKKGYTTTVDWWSLGVCAYEMLFGKRPFRGRTNGELKQSIMKSSIRVPDDAASKCSRQGQTFLRGVSNVVVRPLSALS